MRNRNNDLWSKYAGLIRRDIESNGAQPNDFISDLIGDYSVQAMNGEEESGQNVEIKESELFFPLPWNDEQKRIAERIESNYGVVVKGPPGTGKSHTIANLISRFLSQGKTVLVTSQASKALDVLRDKLPKNIQSLAVAQLQQSVKQDQVLQESIAEISSNLGERHTKFSESQSDKIRTELDTLRQEKAALANKIKTYILSDSQKSIIIDDDRYTPIKAAKLLAQHQEDSSVNWFNDDVKFDQELTFNLDDLKELNGLAKEVHEEDRELYLLDLPNESRLPQENTVAEMFNSYHQLSKKLQYAHTFFNRDPNISAEDLEKLRETCEKAKQILVSLQKDYEKLLFNRCIASDSERQKWFNILKKVFDNLQLIKISEEALLGHEISGDTELTPQQILIAIEAIKSKVADGSKVSMYEKLTLSSNAKLVLNTYKIDGLQPDTITSLELLATDMRAFAAFNENQLILSQAFSNLQASPDLDKTHDSVALELLLKEMTRIVTYVDHYKVIDDFCKKYQTLSRLSYAKSGDIELLLRALDSYSAKYQKSALLEMLRGWQTNIESDRGDKSHEIFNQLIEAIENKNVGDWHNLIIKLQQLREKQNNASRLQELSTKIRPNAPKLYKYVIENGSQGKPIAISNLRLAWKLARLSSWLHAIHDGVDVDRMQRELERLSRQEFELNAELVTVMSWQRQIDRVTKRQRDALMMWSHEMRQYGKGTGKHAFRHLRAAQEALRDAKSAVPVWIMPLNRVAQMFSDPKAGMFDVVIFDEASQCDLKGINVGYLGKKLLVVGDPDQISPGGLFQNQEKIYELIARFLSDIPYKDSFSVTASMFAIASIRLSNIIQLNEHFRCVPEIINFSNHYVYEGKLQPLRYPQPKGQLKPPLVPIFVGNGYQNTNNKANPAEAEAIVDKIEELLQNPKYQTRPNGELCTFGVISLLAEDQAKYISNLINERFDEKTIEDRKIVCGDAYAFQGDERDVMLLSMVKAHDPNKPTETIWPLVKREDMQRFNVASSRARDQMFLFHSFPMTSLHNENDWRLKLLNWFYNPVTEELKVGREALKKEFDIGHASEFSVDVGNKIIDKGYRVIPEYPVIGYRIDLVIQGTSARLAVECDGDQYHTLENWENDQARERQLRRAGWEFWRLTGSSYYRHKETALTSLWEKLDEMNIKPISEE